MKLNLLAFAAHPDDAELACSGTLIKYKKQGKKVGIVDLTRGEMSTRGSAIIRTEESNASTLKMNIDFRINLELEDSKLVEDQESLSKIIAQIRILKPEVVFCNSLSDRHPDHGIAGKMVARACFLAGLRKYEVAVDGIFLEAWRPQNVFHYIQDFYAKPDFVVDISDHMQDKMDTIMCFKSQFYDPESKEPTTPISTPDFLEFVKSRAREFGREIHVSFAEGFISERALKIDDIFAL